MALQSRLLAFLGIERLRPISKIKLISPLLDAPYYESQVPDFKRHKLTAAKHYLRHGCYLGIKPNEYFDSQWYINTYTDVPRIGAEPLVHYAMFGWKELRNPSSNFSTNSYLILNSDVLAARQNPLAHYIRYGAREGRVVLAVDVNIADYFCSIQKQSLPALRSEYDNEPPSLIGDDRLSIPSSDERLYVRFSAQIAGAIWTSNVGTIPTSER